MRIHYGEHESQWGDLSRSEGARGVVAVIHGGFWRERYDASLGVALCDDLVARGFDAYNVEYRRVGGGGGWPGTLADVAAALDALATLDLDLSRLFVVGHSAGGHLAAWSATRRRDDPASVGGAPRVIPTGVIAQAGVMDLRVAARTGVGSGAIVDLLGGGPDDVPERYALADPAMRTASSPVVCVHSREDEDVPFALSEAYVAAAAGRGSPAVLREVRGDHMSHVDPSSPAWGIVRQTLEEWTSPGT